jgi:hypothetical protein
MPSRHVNRVLHVLGDKSWKPQYKYLGSTKDIVGRRDYFEARGIECVELLVKGRQDVHCLAAFQEIDFTGIDAVLMEHPRYPKAMRWLRKRHPGIVQMIRGHNAELIHQAHTSWAYLKSGLAGPRWRFKRARMSARNALDRLSYDIACGRQADYVLAIADWEAEHYWPKFLPRNKVLTVPYFLPQSYLEAPHETHKVHRVICAMSADWSPLAHDAAKVMVQLVDQAKPEQLGGWKFMVTGDLGKHKPDYKAMMASGRIQVTGNLANPFDRLKQARALAHLSNLGMGFKTKLLDFVHYGGWILMPKKLYQRQPEEIRPFCIVVDPLTPEGLSKALIAAKSPWPDPAGVNDRLRERAFAALDRAFGRA